LSESDIKEIAKKANQQIKGTDIGYGIIARGCLAFGRTLSFQYDVPDNWQAPKKLKEQVISNLKTSGLAKNYFMYDINVNFFYFKGGLLIEKVNIKANEFSTFNYKLGDYLSIKGHPKAKGVNLKLKVPIGWEVKEGNRPNIVKKFVKDGSTYLILIKEHMVFFSRNENKDLFEEDNFVNEIVQESISSFNNPEVLDQSTMTIDTYPTIQFKAKGTKERLGITIPMIMRNWMIFYEDKIVLLSCSGIDNGEFKALEKLYFLITNSVIFPEQYN
jgi:hypothetical protein